MYKITFFDYKKNKIATHFISSDNAMPPISYVNYYCMMIGEHYESVKSWRIYDCRSYSMIEGGADESDAALA